MFEDFLDKWAEILPTIREIYGYDFEIKPNDHCTWATVGYTYAWVETDEHLRNRLLNSMEDKSA